MNQKIKILHLEDLSSDAHLVEREVKKGRFPYETKVVYNRKDYIDALINFQPDIILSDHSLPSFNSTEALDLLKQRELHIPFILVTGNVSEEFAVAMIKAGAWDYILKDRMQRLPNAIESAIKRFQLQSLQQKHMAEVNANQLLFKQAESIAQFGIWKVDIPNCISTWSEQTYCLLGYEPFKVRPSYKNFVRNLIHTDIKKVNQAIRQAFRQSTNTCIDFKVQTADMNFRHIRSKFIVEKNEAEQPIEVTGFIQDVTETKMAEDFLYKSKINLQTIFNHTETAFILMDEKFIIHTYNDKAELLILDRFNKSLTNGSYALEYLPQDLKKKFLGIMKRTLNGNKINYETKYHQRNGDVRWLDIRWIPIADKINEKLGLVLSITDITQRKVEEIEKEKNKTTLVQRNKDLEQFNFIVSHNLRAPLTNIIGLIEILKDSKDSQILDHWKQIIPMIDTSSHQLDRVIMNLNTILALKNHLKDATEQVDLYLLMEDIKSILPLGYNEYTILECNFNEIPYLNCIRAYLHSIFFNLISNSIKFRLGNIALRIQIQSRICDGKVELTFRDNGRGIDMKNRNKEVFKLYSRFHQEIEGTGTGLFMVKTQVELMGGKIFVESQINCGTTFTIQLPEQP